MLAISLQNASHSSFPLQPPDPPSIIFMPAAIIFLACSPSSADMNPFSMAKLRHTSPLAGSSQNASQVSLPRQPPGPLPPVFLAITASSADIKPDASAKVMHSSKCSSWPQYSSHSSLPPQAGG